MDDFFSSGQTEKATGKEALPPLAMRMRPQSLAEYVGQDHILGEGKLLRRAIESDRFSALIFYGPPGTGKTSLAEVIAQSTKSFFTNLSGVESNVSEIRKAIEFAEKRQRFNGQNTILFVDEIHRFNKAQQDVLLPHVEKGTVRFIGATTHNPFFYIISPLVSRSMLFALEPLSIENLITLQQRAIEDKAHGFGEKKVHLHPDAAAHFATYSDGDARKCLNALDLAVLTSQANEQGVITIDRAIAEESIQKKIIVYDGDGDAHYDTISAFIKSMRGSDPDATLYWLAKMLHAGEDPRFIARRIVICASEDIGLADNNALRLAIAAKEAVEFVGMPEAQITLAHAAVYLATAPKSNASYAALLAAKKDVQSGRTLAVPLHLRDSHYKGAKDLGHGKEYQYAHNFEGNYVPQAYLPEGRKYYNPTENGQEKRIKERLAYWRAQFEAVEKKETPP